MTTPRIGRVRVAEVMPTVLRRVAFVGAIRPAGLGMGGHPVRCVKCQRPTTRRLDLDVGIHEECEQ